MAAGAVGVCVQKVSEAEALAAGGVANIFITNEVISEAKLARVAALARQVQLGIAVDSALGVERLAHALKAAGRVDAFGVEVFVPELPGIDPSDNVIFLIDDDVCTRCALCVDRCPTGVIILGKIGDPAANGDSHQRTNTHGYGYGMRLG